MNMFLLVVWIGLFVGLNEITRTVTSYDYGKGKCLKKAKAFLSHNRNQL
jgi:hypothetical protein